MNPRVGSESTRIVPHVFFSRSRCVLHMQMVVWPYGRMADVIAEKILAKRLFLDVLKAPECSTRVCVVVVAVAAIAVIAITVLRYHVIFLFIYRSMSSLL